MKIEEFARDIRLTDNVLDSWIKNDLNVLIIGERGTGKTTRILNAFDRNKVKYKYFSGSTLDPWTDLIGIPYPKDEKGEQYIEYILPKGMDSDVEAIFIDEYNRAPKKVKNALLELQQFKSINGRKFPKLRVIWAAINPSSNDEEDDVQYDVEKMDPAQADRFQVIVKIPNVPDRPYFVSTYGEIVGGGAVDWWKEQSKDGKKYVSPRRLDYALSSYKKGINLIHILPVCCNISALVDKIGKSETEILLDKILKNPSEDVIKSLIPDLASWNKYKDLLMENASIWKYFPAAIPAEAFMDALSNHDFQQSVMYMCACGQKEATKKIKSLKSSKYNKLFSIFTILEKKGIIGTLKPQEASFSEKAVKQCFTSLGSIEQECMSRHPNVANCKKDVASLISAMSSYNTQDRTALLKASSSCEFSSMLSFTFGTALCIHCWTSYQAGTLSNPSVAKHLILLSARMACSDNPYVNEMDKVKPYFKTKFLYKGKQLLGQEEFACFCQGGSPGGPVVPAEFKKEFDDAALLAELLV